MLGGHDPFAMWPTQIAESGLINPTPPEEAAKVRETLGWRRAVERVVSGQFVVDSMRSVTQASKKDVVAGEPRKETS
jgi:hypothetical protein